MKRIEMVGKSFGRATVKEELPRNNNRREFLCACACGETFKALGENLRGGHTNSCGCYASQRASEARTVHGEHKGLKTTVETRIWNLMKQRCINPTNTRYADYGGRGITVCERWSVFVNFLADMGRRPTPKHSIERLNNDLGYAPGNCKWATKSEQCNNKRNNVVYTYDGKTLTLAQWAEETGLPYSCLQYRHQKGWPAVKLLTKPSNKK